MTAAGDIKNIAALFDTAIRDGFAFHQHRRGCIGCDECQRLHNTAQASRDIYYHKADELLSERPNYVKGPAT